ncbi:glycine oxidase ThiO [Hoyosella rhizosphaerae]|uniref:glycine oxidase n=1 Tax=Hoyosella rhizosphaerae TaxID=1755582 RepID=A0A916U7U0_9ACTN|nr:glycine oxidase ThiO [Hoyosella rhizosphaerae]GGC61734.1 glycine oxidase ThiO [Hoyosella rhizosphaerae]
MYPSETTSTTVSSRSSSSIAVVGGGVIGASIAWRLARNGHTVSLYEPTPLENTTTWVAGGMVAPLSEAWPGEEALFDLGMASLQRWPRFVDDLGALGRDIITARGAITVGADDADIANVHRVHQWLAERGAQAPMLTRRELRDREPALSRSLRPGFFADQELAVDNRVLLRALRQACELTGVTTITEQVTDLRSLPEPKRIVATGPWTPRLLPSIRIRPVKGEVLRVRRRSTSVEPPQYIIRGWVRGRQVYLVPRPDGLVVGATQYEAGHDTAVTVGGLRDLIADAEVVFPGIVEYEVTDYVAGLRPMTPDGVPLVGAVSDDTIVAAGHGRSGILLAPLTADAVCAEIEGLPMPNIASAHPRRFT